MACGYLNFPLPSKPKSPTPSGTSYSSKLLTSPSLSKASVFHISHTNDENLIRQRFPRRSSPNNRNFKVLASENKQVPLKIIISGAPASGKGTQCQLIKEKYGLVHISAGDLLRTEVAAGTENGKKAKECMEKGKLVPNEIVVMMVKDRLSQPDSEEKGWLLDGYPRSLSQATALREFGFQPDLFILLEVPEDELVERVVGRRLDPVTGKIYHLKYSPPETEDIEARLTQRFDDTEEKVKLRLQTHHENVESVLSLYEDITIKVNGSVERRMYLDRLTVNYQNFFIEREVRWSPWLHSKVHTRRKKNVKESKRNMLVTCVCIFRQIFLPSLFFLPSVLH